MNRMLLKITIEVLMCASLAACGPDSEQNELPVSSDQAAFRRTWDRGLSTYSYDSRALTELPKEMKRWTGKVLVRNTVNGRIELLVVQIADKVAIVAYGLDQELRADLADRDSYVEFSGVRPDNPVPRSGANELRVSGIWALVEVKLDRITVPGKRSGHGIF